MGKPARRVQYVVGSSDARSKHVSTAHLECGHKIVRLPKLAVPQPPFGVEFVPGTYYAPGDTVRCAACPEIDEYGLFEGLRKELGTE